MLGQVEVELDVVAKGQVGAVAGAFEIVGGPAACGELEVRRSVDTQTVALGIGQLCPAHVDRDPLSCGTTYDVCNSSIVLVYRPTRAAPPNTTATGCTPLGTTSSGCTPLGTACFGWGGFVCNRLRTRKRNAGNFSWFGSGPAAAPARCWPGPPAPV